MSYFTSATHAQVIASPESISTIYESAKAQFKSDLGAGFAAEHEDMFKLGLCAIMAYDMKPYGACTVLTLPELLDAPALDCDNYCALTWLLFKQMRPRSSAKIRAIGWNGGAVGNHAQLFASVPGSGGWIVDPTVGVVVCGNYDYNWVAQGKPINSLYMAQPAGVQRDPIPGYTQKIKDALLNGSYRPKDLMYYFWSFDQWIKEGGSSLNWCTPGAEIL